MSWTERADLRLHTQAFMFITLREGGIFAVQYTEAGYDFAMVRILAVSGCIAEGILICPLISSDFYKIEAVFTRQKAPTWTHVVGTLVLLLVSIPELIVLSIYFDFTGFGNADTLSILSFIFLAGGIVLSISVIVKPCLLRRRDAAAARWDAAPADAARHVEGNFGFSNTSISQKANGRKEVQNLSFIATA